MQPDPRLHEGKVIFGRFALKRKLGQGGMGVVWLAHDTLLEQSVALKFVPHFLLEDPKVYELLRKEAQKAIQVTHPHIVRVYDFHRDEALAAISMEYVEGSTLAALKEDRPDAIFDPGEIQKLVLQLCDALGYAHDKAKIVHRDLKPANLMVDRRGDLKVTDFGISAPIADSASRFTNTLRASGTLVYMSPQQIMGMPPQPSDDIYAFGATLYELLTGFPPFYTGDIATQILNRFPPPVRVRREELGLKRTAIAPVWETIIAECLAKEAKGRPATVREIANRLSYAQPVAAAPAAPSAPTPRPRAGVPAAEPDVEATSWKDWMASAPQKYFLMAGVLVLGAYLVFRPASAPKAAAPAPVAQAAARSPAQAAAAPPAVAPDTQVVSAAPVTPPPAPPARPTLPAHHAFPIAADAVFPTPTEGVALVDRAAGEVAFWSKAKPTELVRVTLSGSPVCEAVSPELQRLYLGYADGSITTVALDGSGGEVRFARHPMGPMALASAGRMLVVADSQDRSWSNHHFYDSGGRLVAKTKRSVDLARSFAWSGKQRRLYFVSENVSPTDIFFEEVLPNGTLGKVGDSPYHDSTGMIGPVFLLDRESSVVLGSGRVFKATSLELEMTLPTPVRFLVQGAGGIFVVAETRMKSSSAYLDTRTEMTEAVVHHLSAQYEIDRTVKLPGRPIGLGAWDQGVVVVTRHDKQTRLFWCSPSLEVESLEGP